MASQLQRFAAVSKLCAIFAIACAACGRPPVSALTPLGDTADSLSDGESAQIMLDAHMGEIAIAQAALAKVVRDDVMNYADGIIDAHQTSLDVERALFAQVNVQPSPDDRLIVAQGDALISSLGNQTPETIDVTYICGEVAMHTLMLSLLDTRAIPGAVALRDHLVEQRMEIAQQLQHAQNVAFTIAGNCSP